MLSSGYLFNLLVSQHLPGEPVNLLKTSLLPFIRKKFPRHHRLQQDNDPKHTSNYTKKWLVDNHVDWWYTPAESPDLNPIERVWSTLKMYLSKHVRPKTKTELIAEILDFWKTKMHVAQCKRYINHIHRVIPKVMASSGHMLLWMMFQ